MNVKTNVRAGAGVQRLGDDTYSLPKGVNIKGPSESKCNGIVWNWYRAQSEGNTSGMGQRESQFRDNGCYFVGNADRFPF